MIYNYNDEDIELSIPQARVIRLMTEGWLLRWSNEVSDKRCWFEDESGGEHPQHVTTVNVLEELGIIKQDNAVPIGTFHFVE